jgi:hypothetical protein
MGMLSTVPSIADLLGGTVGPGKYTLHHTGEETTYCSIAVLVVSRCSRRL